jgi:hypothetical protein
MDSENTGNREVNLAPFTEWLVSKEKKAPATANVYTATVRAAIRVIGTSPTVEELEYYASRFAAGTRATFRTSWRHLVRYGKEHGATIVDVVTSRPDLTLEGRRKLQESIPVETQRPSPVPLVVIGAIIYLSRCPGTDLLKSTWSDVTLRNSETRIACQRYGGEYVVAAEPVAALRAWAKPTSDASPLLPDKPGSGTPMPWMFGLHRIFRAWDPQPGEKNPKAKTLPFADLSEPILDQSMCPPPPPPDPNELSFDAWVSKSAREVREAKAAAARTRPPLTSVSAPDLTGRGSKE